MLSFGHIRSISSAESLEMLAVRSSAETFVRRLHGGHVRLTCVDAFFGDFSRLSAVPSSRTSLVVCATLLKDLLRRLRLPRGPRSSFAAFSSIPFFDDCACLPRDPYSSSAAPSSRTWLVIFFRDLKGHHARHLEYSRKTFATQERPGCYEFIDRIINCVIRSFQRRGAVIDMAR